MQNENEIEKILASIEMKAHFIPHSMSRNAGGDWDCINFKLKLSRNGKTIDTNYSMGTGHIDTEGMWKAGVLRRDMNRVLKNVCEYGISQSVDAYFIKGKPIKAKPPKIKDVLWSLHSDFNIGQNCDSFPAFCSELGYDDDSIKALNTFNEVQRIAREFKAMFSTKEISIMDEHVQDY